MFMIQVFDADREFLFTIPMPHPLSEYEHLLKTAESAQDLDDDSEVIHESQVLNAELLSLLARDDTDNPDVMANITGLIMSLVFADPTVQQDFRLKASNHAIQVALPKNPRDDASVQWIRLTVEQRDKMLAAMHPKMAQSYLDQMEESVRYLRQFAEELKMQTKATIAPLEQRAEELRTQVKFSTAPLDPLRRIH